MKPNWLVRSAMPGIVWPALPSPTGAMTLALLFQLEQTQWLPSEELQSRQNTQLERLLAHSIATVPYYRERFRKFASSGRSAMLQHFHELPLLTRSALQSNFDALRSEALPASHGTPHEARTSGSTGAPVRLLGTPLTALFWNALSLRDHLWHRRALGRALAVIRRGVTPGEAQSWGRATDGLIDTGPCHLLEVDCPVSAQIEWLAGCRPAYLLTYPSLVRELARASIERGERLTGLLEVRTFGEAIDTETRTLCKNAWNVSLTDVYSSEEVGYVALQCPEHEHYHSQSEAVRVEILDDAGRPSAPGTIGRVVVTSLHNFATPIIRYDIGDYAEVGEPCSCGRGLPVLQRILGRVRNTLVTASGERYWPAFGLRALQDTLPLRQYQFVQKSYDRIEMRLVTSAPLSADQETALRTRILECLPRGFSLTLHYTDHIGRGAGGKFEDFVSEIASTGAAR